MESVRIKDLVKPKDKAHDCGTNNRGLVDKMQGVYLVELREPAIALFSSWKPSCKPRRKDDYGEKRDWLSVPRGRAI